MPRTHRRILRASLRTLQIVVYAALLSTVLFFGLTRTEVGRSGLKHQLESVVSERVAGSLDIGQLQGDLLNNLYATDVRLRTPDGEVVLSVDSVAARPRWWNLLGGDVSVRSLSLIRPHVRLQRDEQGTWNLRRALRRPGPSSGLLDWVLVNVSVHDGRITTQTDGPVPAAVESGWTFDYGNADLRTLEIDASVEWTSTNRQIGLQNASFALPDQNVRLTAASGQLLYDDEEWILPGITLHSEQTTLQVSGSWSPAHDGSRPEMDVRVAESRIDFDELAPLFPGLPLADAVTVSGHVYGDPSDLVVEEIRAERGRSHLAMEGTFLGLPDSLDLETTVRDAHLTTDDVTAVWPEAPVERVQAMGTTTLHAFAQGVVHWHESDAPTFALNGTLDVTSQAGAVESAFETARAPGARTRYDVLIGTDSLDLGALALRPLLQSRLQGRVHLTGTGLSPNTARTNADLQLGPSRIGDQSLDSLHASLSLAERVFDATLRLQQANGGRLTLRGQVDGASDTPQYELAVSGTAFDLAPLPASLPTTRLNAEVWADGRGRSWKALAGSIRLDVDSSQVTRGDSVRVLPPFQARARVAERGRPGPRITVDGSAATMRLDGDVAVEPMIALARLWGTALEDAVRREVNKPRPDPLASTAPVPRTLPPPPADLSPLRERAREALTAAGYPDTLQLRTSLQIHRSDVVRAWWPAFPRGADSLATELQVMVGPDTLSTQGALAVDRADFGRAAVDRLRIVTRLAGSLRNPLVETLSTEFDVYADTAHVAPFTLRNAGLNLRYAGRTGDFRVEADGTDTLGPLLLDADLSVGPNRNEVVIREVKATVGSQSWANDGVGRIGLFQQTVVVSPFAIESPRLFAPGTQRVRIHGAVSPTPTDTLFVEGRDVSLYPLSQIGGLRPLGGLLTGTLALTRRENQFRANSTLEVQQFSFDRRLLGRLHLQTEFLPSASALEVEAELTPEPLSFDSLKAARAPLVPGGLRRSEPNRLRLGGRVPLGDASDPVSENALDLRLDVDRADLFFFEYIFEEEIARVRGFTAGTAHIGGSFTDPVFDADMRVEEGRFVLPRFGLEYRIHGGVGVDREGFKLQNVVVADDDGSATLDGGILFNDYRFFSFDLRGELDEIKIIDVSKSEDLPFYGDIRVSGPATLTGPLSNAQLTSNELRATPESELFIPVSESEMENDTGFLLFADSTGRVPDISDLTRRDNILADRPAGEPTFVEGLEFDVNIFAPEGSTVHLVFDPLVGDVVTANGSGRIQLQREEGEFFVYGTYTVSGGHYQFTAGEVFVRRFRIEDGTITWDGNPINAALNLNAAYQTRASTAGLPGYEDRVSRIPLIVNLNITGNVEAPQVDLSLSRARDERTQLVGSQTLDAILNQPELATEYATSVLLTNTFLLTTSTLTEAGAGDDNRIAQAGNQLAFNSVSQLVASQLNRYLNEALPNLNVNLGIQGEDPQDLDVIYGVALRLLDERLIIRGEGVYTGDDPSAREAQGPEGEFTVEVRLSSRVSVEAFVRRRGDDLTQGQTLTRSAGAGISYHTEFTTWKRLFYRVFGWLLPTPEPEPEELPAAGDMVIRPSEDAAGDEETPATHNPRPTPRKKDRGTAGKT